VRSLPVPLPLLALFVSAFAVGTTELVIAGLLPALAADLAVDVPTAGLLISGYAMGVAVGGPLLALATTGLPRRSLLLALMAVFVAGNVLCALAPGYGLLMAARLVIAGSHGLFFGVAMVIATGLVAHGRQAFAVSVVITGITVANVLGVPAGTALGNAFGWRVSFWAIAVVGLLSILALAWLIPRAEVGAQRGGPGLRAELGAAARPQVLAAYGMIALAMTAFFACFAYIVPIMTEVSGISTAMVPLFLFLSGIGGIFGGLAGGRLGDWKPVPVLVVIFALELALYLAALAAVHDGAAFAVVIVLWSLIGFAFGAPVQSLVLRGAADAPNLASTLISTAFNVGIAAGASLGGAALAAGWSLACLPGLSAFFLALALCLALYTATLGPPRAGRR
jgi:DHA1 family inner membrane transport protein